MQKFHTKEGKPDFRASVKTWYAPKIASKTMDEGNVVLLLENGNTIPEMIYNKWWKPTKGLIFPRSYKGENVKRINTIYK